MLQFLLTLQYIFIVIGKHLDNSHILMSGGACTALGEIGRCGALPLPNDNPDDTTTKLSIVNNLIGKVQSTKENEKVELNQTRYFVSINKQ